MRAAIRIIGILALLLGIWWILQGTGFAPVGFMANQMPWAYRGMGLVVTGTVLLLFARQNRSL
ncbi:MAG: hypothetical protein ACOY5H_02065 [Pseudomonadota bacterium]